MAHTLTGTLHGNIITLDANLTGPDKEDATQRVRVVLEPLGREEQRDEGAVLRELASRGRMRSGARNAPESYPYLDPILTHGTGQELLDEDRGDR